MLDDDELGPSRQRRMLDGGGHGAQSEADLDPLFLCAAAASIFFGSSPATSSSSWTTSGGAVILAKVAVDRSPVAVFVFLAELG